MFKTHVTLFKKQLCLGKIKTVEKLFASVEGLNGAIITLYTDDPCPFKTIILNIISTFNYNQQNNEVCECQQYKYLPRLIPTISYYISHYCDHCRKIYIAR